MKFETESTFTPRSVETEAYMKEQLELDFATNPERVVAENPEVQEKLAQASEAGQNEAKLDTLSEFAEEVNPNLVPEIEAMRAELSEKSKEHEQELEMAKLKAEIKEFNEMVQKSEVMSRFGSEHGFNKDETYAFVENKILANEKRIHELETNKNLLKAEVEHVEQLDELARMKAEIEELNKMVQRSEAMEQLGKDHGFNKEKVYTYIENRIRELEEKIHELEGQGKEKKEEEDEPTPEPVPTPEPIPVPTPEPIPTPEPTPSTEEKPKNWWGWIKERAKGFATMGYWEFHQAERFRSNKKEAAEDLAESAERIRKTEHLSLEDALIEAQTITLLAETGGLARPGTEDYERFSNAITGQKVEENNKYIETLVAGSSAELKERLKKYRDEFGEVVVSDTAIMAGFEDNLRQSLLGLQDGLRNSDAKQFNELITNRLDPNYWRRYVYGGVEMALVALGLQFAASKLWLGKKVVDVIPDNMITDSGITDTIPNAPGPVAEAMNPEAMTDIQMKDTIWRTGKEWLQKNGIMNPTNSEIMNVSKQVATDNGIGVKVWNIPGEPLDTGMQQGHLLKFGGAMKVLTAIRIARGIASVI